MSETLKQLKARLSVLPARERADLAYFLINSLDGEADPDWESSWDQELIGRESEITAGRVVGECADKVFAELREKYARLSSSWTEEP